ncbi:helix-turn-helix domain-containing protein [Dolichospermum circinale]|uniref:AlbA family DNA-binding domain-containing protein n=1 Tax=Dolichospermum circinale TaxID=109265 RepID=UPI00232D78F8|nr:ATP-binding protein [Dolichospermum circinale]MDB9454160.1 ATP-binding protein [Dolichospermum circinale CS-541/06]MDB9464636.1 ATP-binding protein [Dolichospermum circinale CS-541/04]MDB9549626.1 ATP-binding protein [Dolichospermum circinale CS-1031]
MNFNIDLKELARRESEQVEWKENGDDIKIAEGIVKTISAFANDIANVGGGYVVCGAKEIKDEHGFPKIQYTGLSANKLKEVELKVTKYCQNYVDPAIIPRIVEIENPENNSTRILVFVVLRTRHAHIYRDGETSKYYVRISRETKEARNGVLRQLLTEKQEIEYFDKRTNTRAMDKAKKCITAIKNRKSNTTTKKRASLLCEQLLEAAQRDLNLALENVENPHEKNFIEKDFNFLNELKQTYKKTSTK